MLLLAFSPLSLLFSSLLFSTVNQCHSQTLTLINPHQHPVRHLISTLPITSLPPQLLACFYMDREERKEKFRKYLESTGVVDALTKALVSLYQEDPSIPATINAVEYIKQKLGGPSMSEHEKLQADNVDLQRKYDELLAAHRETCKQLEELRNLKCEACGKEMVDSNDLKGM